MLGEDFIAPLAASALFTDGVQRLLPFPVRAWDRARAPAVAVPPRAPKDADAPAAPPVRQSNAPVR